MNERLIITKPTSRSKIETIAAIITLAAHRRKLTRWVVTKQDVVDLLEKHKQLQNRVRTAGFFNNLQMAMNEYDIAVFELNPNTWAFMHHSATRNWHRVTWNSVTQGELTNPNVFEIETAFGYKGTDFGERHTRVPAESKAKQEFKELQKRFAKLCTGHTFVQLFADSYGPQHALRTENVEQLAISVKTLESMILAPREYLDDMSHQQYMIEFAKLEMDFDTEGLIRDTEGNYCEVTERHIAERKWDMFLRGELRQILEGLKARLRERYGV